MEKIFEPETEQYLVSCGVSVKEINRLKFEAAKKDAITIIEKVLSHIKQNQFNKIEAYLESSPSGDGYGCDNMYITFSGCAPELEDISTLALFLQALHESIK